MMRSFGMLAGGLVAAVLAGATPALAQMQGATSGAPMQPGGWGNGGWQAGSAAQGGPGFASTGYGPDHGGAGYGMSGHAGGDYRGMGPARGYRRPTQGWRMPSAYLGPDYVVGDWQAWGLGQPGPGMRWVRYYGDAVMIDSYGRVVDSRPDFDWERGRHGGHGYAGGAGYPGGAGYDYAPPGVGYPAPGPGYPPPGVTRYRAGPNTVVTTSVVPAPPPVVIAPPVPSYGGYAYGGGGYYAGGGSVVTVTPGAVVTTTTTTTDYETVYKDVYVRQARKVWRRPVRRPSHPRCARVTTCPVLGS